MNILGISAFYHDSAACLVQNGQIISAAQEERFTRKKHDAEFPSNAISYCLRNSGLLMKDVDAIAFYDKPLLKFERLLETYLSFAPKGVSSFIAAMPVWLKEKMFLKKVMHDELTKLGDYDRKKIKLLFPEHHLSHAASAFYTSPFDEAAILTIDGVGEWATAAIYEGKGRDIRILKELTFPHSVGLLYSSFTYFLGFKVNSGEYKLMGLAPFGNRHSKLVEEYIERIKAEIVEIRDDGSIYLNQEYFSYATGLKMIQEKKWENLFGFPKRGEGDELQQYEADLALAIQIVTEEIMIKMAMEARKITGSKNICLAGGVALNCVANGKLQNSDIFDGIYVQPASGDAGGSIGAALAAYHIYFEKERIPTVPDSMNGSYLGPHFHFHEIEEQLRSYRAVWQHLEDDTLYNKTAALLNSGKVIGWFQGRMEFGPRSLGNRSILADPRSPEMQKKLNLKIKYRESFRPFAPAVLAEDANSYFEMKADSPYMLFVQPVRASYKEKLPDNYHELPLREKLDVVRSEFPAITHVDFSARIQTVHRQTNPDFWNLLQAFKALTGTGMLVNTSFNVRGEPIICTPKDAYLCFMNTDMDYLIIENYIFDKADQPKWEKKAYFEKD